MKEGPGVPQYRRDQRWNLLVHFSRFEEQQISCSTPCGSLILHAKKNRRGAENRCWSNHHKSLRSGWLSDHDCIGVQSLYASSLQLGQQMWFD